MASSSSEAAPKLLWNPDNVRDVAESIGIASLGDEALKALTQDVEYRVGQVIVEALRLMRASRRTTLTVGDVSLAMRVLDVEPLYGYDSTRPLRYGEASLGPGQPLFYIEDEEVDFEKLINAPLPKVPRDMSITAHWLAIEGVQPAVPQNPSNSEARAGELLPKGPGANPALAALAGDDGITSSSTGASNGSGGGVPGSAPGKPPVKHIVSKELILYFDKIQAAILDDNPDEEVARLRQAALGSVRDDPGLHQLVPYFINFVMDRVTHALDDTFVLRRMMELVGALIENKTLFLDPYASPLSAPVLTCLMARKLGADNNNSNNGAAAAAAVGGSAGNDNGGSDGSGEGAAALREQYQLRELAASLVGRIARKYAASNSLLRPKLTRTCLKYLLDPTKPPAVLYGAVQGLLEAGGPEAIRVLVLRNLRPFDENILQPLKDKAANSSSSLEYSMLLQAVVRAVSSLVKAEDGSGDSRMGGADGPGVSEADAAALVEYVGPIVGRQIAGLGNQALVAAVLDARNLA
ncbi:hypothetical protein N3K66_007079 [Trichothecium roseum]|uniref:Uncharacterized protein n=1 Tax=Trichothecium roseum TaxID=47278 RepID=A0ACC0UXL5_9HYPO|nr:hypothetical protein N3K66_007079 [Trichothecium roseum]